MKTFKIPSHENMDFVFHIETYTTNGNTYVGIDCKEDDFWEPYANLTVNLDMILNSNQAFIDANNLDGEFIKYLEEQGFISNTGLKRQSGFVLYPLYTLNLDKIEEYSRWKN